jgi:hypothetical protein
MEEGENEDDCQVAETGSEGFRFHLVRLSHWAAFLASLLLPRMRAKSQERERGDGEDGHSRGRRGDPEQWD